MVIYAHIYIIRIYIYLYILYIQKAFASSTRDECWQIHNLLGGSKTICIPTSTKNGSQGVPCCNDMNLMHEGLSNFKGRKSTIQPWYIYIYVTSPIFSIGPSATFVRELHDWACCGFGFWRVPNFCCLCTILRGWNGKLALGYEIPWMRSIPFTPPGRHTRLSVGVGLG